MHTSGRRHIEQTKPEIRFQISTLTTMPAINKKGKGKESPNCLNKGKLAFAVCIPNAIKSLNLSS